jgi:hypothetical protein
LCASLRKRILTATKFVCVNDFANRFGVGGVGQCRTNRSGVKMIATTFAKIFGSTMFGN